MDADEAEQDRGDVPGDGHGHLAGGRVHLTDDRRAGGDGALRLTAGLCGVELQASWYHGLSEALQAQAVGPLLNKLRAFLLRGAVRAIVGQPRTTLDIPRVINDGRLLLARLPKGTLGEDTSRLLGSMIVARAWQAALARAALAPEQRADAALHIDEVQNFLNLPTPILTGLRRAELIDVIWTDVDLDGAEPSLLVQHGKGGKPRRQPLPSQLVAELKRWRAGRKPSPQQHVFCGLAGGRLQPNVLADIIRRCAARAGLAKHVTAHTLRHTAATWLRQATGDTRLVAEYLGHADLSTVSRYAHVATREMHTAVQTLADQARLSSSPESARQDHDEERRQAA